MTITVVVVDDHAVFREGLRTVLAGQPDIEVVGEAASAAEALLAVRDHRPSVVLMDLHLPGASGIQATERIVAEYPGIAVLVLTMLDDETSVRAAMRAGARGYLVKDSGLDDIVRGIQSVAAGQLLLGAAVADHALRLGSEPADLGLTDRELQLSKLLVDGATTGQIALRLGISTKTVRNHVSNIYTKLGVQDRGQAVLALQRALRR